MDQSADYDSAWKDVLRTFFPQFMELLFPQIHADIDWSRGVEFLDTELQKVVRDAELGRRFADKLVRVYRRGGEETWVLVHVEVQGQPDPTLPQRIYVYNYRLYDYNGRRVVSLVVLADPQSGWRPDCYEDDLWGCSIRLRFPVVKILDWAGRTAELEQSGNPFAVVVLAQLSALAARGNSEERLQGKWQLVRGLYDRGYTRAQILELFRFIEWVLVLPPGLQDRFKNLVREYEKERAMPYVTEVERSATERGMQQGMLEDARESVLDNLEMCFGPVPPLIRERVQQLSDRDTLRRLRRRALAVSSLEEFERELPAPPAA